ncbi:MAG: hypothetical protein AB7G11_07135 [Phycisphaerales bacterium]
MKRSVISAACYVVCAASTLAGAQPADPSGPIHSLEQPPAPGGRPTGSVRATASRGVAGEFVLEYAGPVLRAKPNQALTSPMLVRLELLDTGQIKPGEKRRYRLSFIGAVAGTFDLREFIERADGQALTDLPELSVAVVSQLPEKHGTDLFTAKHPTFLLQSHYHTLMYVFIGLWLAVPALVLVRRSLRRRAATVQTPAPPPPTLAEQLRPLVEAAATRDLSIAERGRLELLLISFWRDRLGLWSLAPAQAIGRIRADQTAGRLLGAVERWLHARGSGTGRPTDDIAALLEPYRSMPAVHVTTEPGPHQAEAAP